MATDLRAAILAATREIRASCIDLEALAGIDRELTRAEIVEVWRLSEELLLSAGRLNYDAEQEWAGLRYSASQTVGGHS